jgi:hypothetical protein
MVLRLRASRAPREGGGEERAQGVGLGVCVCMSRCMYRGSCEDKENVVKESELCVELVVVNREHYRVQTSLRSLYT